MANDNIPKKKIKFDKIGIKSKPKKKVKKEKPRILTCILSGKEFKIPFPALLKQMIRLKLDSLDDYQEFYICKEARKLLAEGKTIDEIRKSFNCVTTLEVPFRILKCYVKKFKTKADIERKRKRDLVKEMLKALRENNAKAFCGNQTIPYDLDNKNHIAELTKDACIRQDIYLNGGRVCDECKFYKFCECKMKKVSKYYDK